MDFIQGLVTNDLRVLEEKKEDAIHAAMMTPKGKMIFDVIITKGSQDGNRTHFVMHISCVKLSFPLLLTEAVSPYIRSQMKTRTYWIALKVHCPRHFY